MNTGSLGGNVSIAAKQQLIKKYLSRLAPVDLGPRRQCRCGGTAYVLWRKRWYCPTCGQWVHQFAH